MVLEFLHGATYKSTYICIEISTKIKAIMTQLLDLALLMENQQFFPTDPLENTAVHFFRSPKD